MAKISLGPTGREVLNIEIGNGEGQKRGVNTQVNTPPPPATTARAEVEEPAAKPENAGGRVEIKGGPETGGQTTGTGRQIELGGGPERENGGLGTGPRGDQTIKPGQTPPAEPPDAEWPIFPALFRNARPHLERERAGEDRRRDDDVERNHREGYDANRASLRRGQIRDYLRQNLQNAIIEARNGTSDPIDVQRLTQTVAERLSRTLHDPTIVAGRTLELIAHEISNLLSRGVQSAMPMAVPYDRAIQLAGTLLARLPAEARAAFPQMSPQALLDGLMILQLCSNPGAFIKEMREITCHNPSILPNGIPWSSFRDTGLLAANFLKEGTSPKGAAHIEAAVQRFLKLLAANNEFGVLMAAVRLTADARAGRLPSGSVAALVRIYELIAQLAVASERAMKESAEAAARKPADLKRTDNGLAFSSALEPAESEAVLRQYLAFNPATQADSTAGAFFDEHLAETSARIAVDSSQREILEWLGSGRHRFVAEADIGKPIGIVLDRSSDECFTASRIRVVLVRDGSVLGWHVLRSSLVG